MYKILFLFCMWLAAFKSLAHPMPNSIVNLSVLSSSIAGEAKMPLAELESAVKAETGGLVNTPYFRSYFTDHIRAMAGDGKYWITRIDSIGLATGNDPGRGDYQEVVVQFTMTPAAGASLRKFTFLYDAVIHQVVTHHILVNVAQDWHNGIGGEDNNETVGVIKMDVRSEKIFPLEVNLEEGSWWKGCKAMMALGITHISEGTDHLLFLLVLLLPAALVAENGRWTRFGGTRYSVVRLLKMVTAFTAGHSVSLLLGAMKWLVLPQQPIEVAIAVTILISAIHAIRPLFYNREVYVAGGFGLIHGLAFAAALSDLHLNAGEMALSILSFNTGIELMQLLVMLCFIPWLVVLSRSRGYSIIRITGAVMAIIAALAWAAERLTGIPNRAAALVQQVAEQGQWLVLLLAVLAAGSWLYKRLAKTTRPHMQVVK